MDWARIHERREIRPISFPLAFFSMLYGMVVGLRNKAYERRRRYRLPGFTMSIGNVTTGGTGKTPAVVMVAKWAAEQGFRVAVLSRGYGGRYNKDVLEVSDGKDIKAGAEEAGDEPVLLAAKLHGVPVVLARKRHLAGLYAFDRFKSNFFLLDDGFQHIGVQRDMDMVLLDAASPFGNGRLLPWGPLREPKSSLDRATAFLITRWSGTIREKRWMEYITRRFPGKPLFRSVHVPENIIFRGESHDIRFLKGKRVFAFAGIARPDAFRQTLVDAGAELADFRPFRDHHPFSESEVLALVSDAELSGADLLITTEKDWTRLERFRTLCPDLACLTVCMRLLPDENGFFDLVKRAYAERQVLRP